MNKSAGLHGCKHDPAAPAAMIERILLGAASGVRCAGLAPALDSTMLIPTSAEHRNVDGLKLIVSGARRAEFKIGDAVIRPSSQNREANFVTALRNRPASLPRCAC